MAEAKTGMHRYRSHTCGALRAADIGKPVRLKLAGGDPLFEILTAQHVFKILHAVDLGDKGVNIGGIGRRIERDERCIHMAGSPQ